MPKWCRQTLAFSFDPRAWFALVVSLGLTGWLGYATIEGRIIAGTVSGLLFISVAFRGLARRRIADLTVEVAATGGEADEARALVDGAPGIMWRSDAEGNRKFLSNLWPAATGRPIAKSLESGWLECVHPDDRERCGSTLLMALAGKEPYEVEYRLQRPDGDHRWVVERAAPIFGREKAFSGYVGIILDTGQAVKASRENDEDVARLLRLNASINKQAMDLADRYETLEKIKEEADFRDRTKCDFLAALADDLRPAIEVVGSSIELLAGADLAEQEKELVDRIAAASGILDGILTRTVALSSISEEAEAREPDRFDMRRLIHDVVASFDDTAREQKVALSSFVEDAVPASVEADATRLRRLITELFSCTLGAASGGRVSLRVERAAASGTDIQIRFALSVDAESIPAQQVERAFYPAEVMGSEPAGLGLNVCRRLAVHMGGACGVQREDNGGHTFWLTVKVADLNPNFDGRRAHGRLAQESLRSNLGAVLDMSLGGMRVRTAKPYEGEVDVELEDDEEKLLLRAEVAWCRRVGFGKHEAGLRFLACDPGISAQLGRLATRNRMRRVLEAA